MDAAKYGKDDIVRIFINAGADIDHRNENGDTALILSAKEGHWETFKTLIEFGADIHIKNKVGDTAHMVAEKYYPSKISYWS